MHSADGAGDERIIFATLESLNDDTFSTKISEAPSAFHLLYGKSKNQCQHDQQISFFADQSSCL